MTNDLEPNPPIYPDGTATGSCQCFPSTTVPQQHNHMQTFSARLGWECPNCHRCYSPSTAMCLVCGQGEIATSSGSSEFTWTTTTNNDDRYITVDPETGEIGYSCPDCEGWVVVELSGEPHVCEAEPPEDAAP